MLWLHTLHLNSTEPTYSKYFGSTDIVSNETNMQQGYQDYNK